MSCLCPARDDVLDNKSSLPELGKVSGLGELPEVIQETSSARNDDDVFDISSLPELVTLHIVKYLQPDDVARWAQSSRYFQELLPRYVAMIGEPFHIYGPYRGEGTEIYFKGPILEQKVRRLVMSVVWVDQGWGNKKGDIHVRLMRGDTEISVMYRTFGICDHSETSREKELISHSLVTEAMPGDYYQFSRQPGGGGGHELKVKKFRAIAELYS